MAKLTKEEIAQLKQELEQKTEELKVIYNKLMDAGVPPLPDDFLDTVTGGGIGPRPTSQVIHDASEKESLSSAPGDSFISGPVSYNLRH